MNDDRYAQYLRSRATTIDVPATDVGVIAERVRDRRHRRHVRAARVAGAVVVLGAAATAVALAGEDRTPVEAADLASQPSPLDWQVVSPIAGLGNDSGLLPVDGALYGLSTAPGPARPGDEGAFRSSTLYRSTDGAEWEALELPDDLYASALSAGSGRLYAVGTGPTGGEGVPLRLATSDDGGASWGAPTDLDAGLADLQERFGAEVSIGRPTIATHGATTLVAVSVSATIDVEARVPDDVDVSAGWSTTPTGVDVYGAADGDGCERGAAPCAAPEVVRQLTYEELGVPAELAALLSPDVVLLASDDGAPFVPVEPPAREALTTRVLATDTGFALVAQDGASLADPAARGTARVFTSADGRTWDERPVIPGYVEGAGRIAGATALSVRLDDGDASGVSIVLLGDDGGRQSIDPLSVLPPEVAAEEPFTTVVGFGPMGWATVVQTSAGGRLLVHSDPGGTVLSTVGFPPDLGAAFESGITVSADAIVVRFTDRPDADPGTPTGQLLYVGTPR